ncbi:MAG TPA: TA system VapC family ribonuclease toxin [Rhizomicrobium sp.]
MSFGVDVNILLYASDARSPLNSKASEFLARCAVNREVFCLAWVTLMSYLRISTHPSIFERPLTHGEALHNVGALLGLPHCRAIGEDDSFWDTYRRVAADIPTRGNFVPDAQLASILLGHGIRTLYTHDRDFRKFPFLDVRDPLA